MLHAVKKHLGRAKQPLVAAPNAQFADYKQRLVSIRASLKYTLSMLAAANRGWILQIQQQRHFSDRFHEAYPTTHDDVHAVAAQFATGSQALYDKFTRDAADHDLTAHLKIQQQVLLYIKEIEKLEATYPKLATAKSEADRYQAKLDAMERSRRPNDESKKTRNLQKMDRHKDTYKQLLKLTIDQQKHTYAKHPVVFKAALTSYWLNHEKHVTLLVESLEQTQQFAKKHEKEMRRLDISTYEPDLAALLPAAFSANAPAVSPLSSSVSASSASSSSAAAAASAGAPDAKKSVRREETRAPKITKVHSVRHAVPDESAPSPTSVHDFPPEKNPDSAAKKPTNDGSGKAEPSSPMTTPGEEAALHATAA